ncbi:isoprenylcysteine carboxylmethyltransferase family protein [Peteryoungia desertarenae]|uniref:Isoprenylcysteine carboxylmethyltransferase family protein n=1 Tax=Peteryoungia desertarenae TaxID=1813451 RepID=A0ABX6QQX6_9HYPH|nr:isoprenylcysteine carboxylmethyltransferase family protein [Peteryoungia desertarenae]QLF70555.1 isoprenylcysteine carboxylmethyltransferase family protein [Peteryoungia desertarenae]
MNAYRLKPLSFPWPPTAFGLGVVLAFLLGRLTGPLPDLSQFAYPLTIIGIVFGLAGAALHGWAVMTLVDHNTPILHSGCTRRLVTTGPYAISRNPIYLGYLLLTVAVGLITGISWFLIAAAIGFAITTGFAIPCEEKHLLARFGIEFENYCKRARRWI